MPVGLYASYQGAGNPPAAMVSAPVGLDSPPVGLLIKSTQVDFVYVAPECYSEGNWQIRDAPEDTVIHQALTLVFHLPQTSDIC
ncbi:MULTISPECIES: hypothetical protein [Nostocales]|uniref:Uncharacterized protein n=3 Tax=Nostocales TaxID=1161 RepID=A0A0C1QTY1_9CYAN|nr:hypothetical protein [Tolypothrix bouteillei]KAF3885440.1 hypothetical protein DA73_0400008200 [Tolypothrix bouteillei VB521301]